MGTSGSIIGREKTKGFLKISLKARDGHWHTQTQMRAVCSASIASSPSVTSADSQRRALTGPQQAAALCEHTLLLLLSFPPLPWPTQRTLLLPYQGKDSKLLLLSFQGWEHQGSYPGSLTASRKIKAMYSWHHQNYLVLTSLESWGLRRAGSQTSHFRSES